MGGRCPSPSSPRRLAQVMKTTLTFFAVLFLSALSFASTDCQSTFSVGSGQYVIYFCVTANGNIAYFSSGLPEIQDGAEGYALCNGSGSDAWDLGFYGDSG